MRCLLITLLITFYCQAATARVTPNHIFSDNMVLQRDKRVKIWGWASPREKVLVIFGKQKKNTVTDENGEWSLYLDPEKANILPQDLVIKGTNTIVLTNVLVGDVWVLGGQSNMEFDLDRIYNGDLEVASAYFNNIRLMTIPAASGIKPKKDFECVNEYDGWLDRYDEKGGWFISSPQTAKTFSAMGFVFGRRIHMASRVPIGLIDVSVGGTTLEAWLSSETLHEVPGDSKLVAEWDKKVNAFNPEDNLKQKMANWEKRAEIRKKQGLEPAPKPILPDLNPAMDRNYPGASYNGMVAAIAGFSVKGVIFNQGYNNALTGDARPVLYARNFIGLINDWRKTFHDENLPFGIIELSAGGTPQTLDNYELEIMTDPAPYIREGQFKAYQHYTNTGFVAIYDQQENWYHPRKKLEAGERMARWALQTQYGIDMGWVPAACIDVNRKSDRIIVTFSKEIKTWDDRPFDGFAIAGENGHFYPAQAKYFVKEKDKAGNDVPDKTKLVIWNDLVPAPKEVRYAWARNPFGNAVNDANRERVIPLPSFRTDSWNYPEAPFEKEELDVYRKKLTELRNQALEWNKQRKMQEIKQANKGF